MSTFKSPEVLVNRSSKYLFNKLGDLNNLRAILPKEIEEFQSTETSCSFKMKGLPKLIFEISEKFEFSKITYKAIDSQVPLLLTCHIKENENNCQAQLEINAELNIMMKMMVEKPLTNFLDILSRKIQAI